MSTGATHGAHQLRIHSTTQWVAWQCGVSPARAKSLVAMARRRGELPVTSAAHEAGELCEDQVAVIVRHAPAGVDAEMAELARSAPAATPAPAEPRSSQPELSADEREERLSAVLAEILDDPASGFRTDSVLYQEFLVRLRMRRVPGPPMPLPEPSATRIGQGYGVAFAR